MISQVQVETAVEAYLAAKLTADATLSAVTYQVTPAITKDDLPEDRFLVVVRCGPIPQEIAGLYDPMVDIVLNSPIDVASVTVADHALLETAIAKAFDKVETATAVSDLSDEIETAISDHTGADFFATGWQPGKEENGLVPAFEVKVGVIKI